MKRKIITILIAISVVGILVLAAGWTSIFGNNTKNEAPAVVTIPRDAKIAYKEAHGIKDESEPESSVPEETETKPFEKFFMVFMVVIMTIGIVGLPLYYFLNNRKKRLLKEYKERKNDESEEPSETDNDGKPEE